MVGGGRLKKKTRRKRASGGYGSMVGGGGYGSITGGGGLFKKRKRRKVGVKSRKTAVGKIYRGFSRI